MSQVKSQTVSLGNATETNLFGNRKMGTVAAQRVGRTGAFLYFHCTQS